MEILLVFPGKIWGGAEQYVLDLGKALTSLGNNVKYVANNTAPIRNRLRKESIDIEFLPIGNMFNLKSIRKFSKRIGNSGIIHIHDVKHVPWAVLAKKMAKSEAKIVVTRHIARASHTLPWHKIFFRSISDIIFVSGLSKKLWLSRNRWMPEQKCHIVLNSVANNAPANSCQVLREKYGIGLNVPILAFSGRIRKSKGCEVIINALAELKDYDYRMVFIGAWKPKDYNEKLMTLAKELGIDDKIIFYGFSNNPSSLLNGIDIGLVPSIVREACPLSPMEFMQAGIPVIATNNGGQVEYIKDGFNGFLINPNDSKALATAIKRLLDNPTERKNIGENAMNYFKSNMSYPFFLKKIITVYKSIQ